jgi:hypothetical protein
MASGTHFLVRQLCDKTEKADPEKRQRRMEDDDCKKINFFEGHTRATVSDPADTVGAAVLDSVSVLVHETLSDIANRLENRLSLDQKSTWFPDIFTVSGFFKFMD